MVGIRFGGARDEILTLMQRLGVITPPYLVASHASTLNKIYMRVCLSQRNENTIVCNAVCFVLKSWWRQHC